MTLGKATKRSTCFVLIGWLDPPTDHNRLRPFSEIQRPENTSPFSILSFAWLSQILVGSGAQLRHSGPLVLASAARPARPPRTLPRPRLAPLALLRLSSARRASEDGIASATAGEPCPPTQHVTMLLATTSDCRHRRPQLASSRCRSTLVPPLGPPRARMRRSAWYDTAATTGAHPDVFFLILLKRFLEYLMCGTRRTTWTRGRCRLLYFAEYLRLTLGKAFAECPTEGTQQSPLCR